ncbi:aminotransferase class I/II-fold pyridoxal phosphate-dependent enzyme [Permianibacter aggregans]|uniref:Aminotransferase n=1 Tax=Permianibacter aggregans TaxID=1510150 RepID=A0A4R6UGA2_9GAMM|nr:aminotransferase class I/II-fold pyridoxal phosphate-dependent enzyme [Permianibacter aggregans]QGX41205.1 aminotransferase class I/II-fold pyridoxal phosphate-dependent enzyme [Permianibacter aggregans]TDQ45808.1 histidinol-phosphate aminotransferase [Permianibacter aggregans]
MLKLDFNERCEGTPFWAAQTMQALDMSSLWRYPDRQPLELAIAKRFGLREAQVLATNGGDEGIDLLLRLAKRQRRQLVLPLPAFSMYKITAARNELSVISIDGKANRALDLDAVVEPIQATGRLLALTSPNNPTGETITREQLIYLITQARAFGNPVLLDEAYAEFAGESALDLLEQFDNLIILRSFSKAFGLAGLRVGCLLGQEKWLNDLRNMAPPFNLSTPSILMASAACQPQALSEMENYCRTIASARDELREKLLQRGFEVLPSQGNFLLLPLSPARAELVSRYLQRFGIKVRAFTENELQGCLRITIPSDTQLLSDALLTALSPELLCLDMDGVLVDTRESYDACVKATIIALGGKEPSDEALRETRNSGGYNDDWTLTQALLQRQGKQVDYEQVKNLFQTFYLGSAQSPGLRLKEKAVPTETTRQRLAATRYAIFTGRPRIEAEAGTELCRLSPVQIVSRDDVQNGKPDPEGLLQLRSKQQVNALWMVGDSVDDMRAARAVNAVAIGIGIDNIEALLAAGADTVLADINALGELL